MCLRHSLFYLHILQYDVPRTVCLLPEFQRASVVKSNAIKMLLTFGQPKYRLFLLCEGNGDGTGVHFLDYSKHEGYRVDDTVATGLIKESVQLLRFTFKVCVSQRFHLVTHQTNGGPSQHLTVVKR